jgi:ketosteroid isomerase-like protein
MDPCHDLQASQPVRIPDEHWTGTPKEMHERAEQIMRAFGPVRHPQLGTIRFSRDGRDKTLSEKRTPHEFQSVRALPELIRRGPVVSTTADRKGRQDIRAWHKLEHVLQIGDALYQTEITVKEFRDGSAIAHKFYLHRIKNVEASSPYIADPALRPSRGPAGQ